MSKKRKELKLIIDENNNFSFEGTSFQITKNKNKLLKPYGKQLLNFGKKIELLPTIEQVTDINQQIGNARFVGNKYLNERMDYYDNTKETLSVSKYKKEYLPKLKEENDFLKLSDKFALEGAIENIDSAYNNFFSGRAGFPKFVSKNKPNGNRYTTKETNGNIKVLFKDNLPYIQLPRVGKIRFILPKNETIDTFLPKGAHITKATVERIGKRYFVSLQIELIIDEINIVNTLSKSDIYAGDLGIKTFLVYGNDSETIEVANPRWIKVHEKKLRRFQKALSRKYYDTKTHKGSKNYYKMKDKLAKEHLKVKNQRKDFQHKLSRTIVNKCKVFISENLNISGMVKNHKLAKEISSVAWGQFLTFVKYKLERKGGLFIKVDRFYASSKLCNKCGYKKTDLKLSDRIWKCPQCGTVHDRDINAKDNILCEGTKILLNNYDITLI